MTEQKERKGLGKPSTDVSKPTRGRAPSEETPSKATLKGVSTQVSLFEKVPKEAKLAWPNIAAILSGVVSSLSKLMGGGIVAFYAGCQLGGLAVAITFALSFILTYFVGKICYREGLVNNVVSRFYIFGRNGSVAGSLIWIFCLVGVLAVGTVQLGNAILFATGWSEEWMRWALFLGISCIWVIMALFGTKIIARMNAVFVVALFCIMGYVVYLICIDGQLYDAATHGILIPDVDPLQGFAYSVNYAIMTSGLLALFAADFTRFARKERDLIPISLVGSLFAIITYIFGALITYYGFSQSLEYFTNMGYTGATAANMAVTNPGVSLVLASGGVGLAIICLSQLKVETSNSIGGANAVSNLLNCLTGRRISWVWAVIIANTIGLAFILGGILEQINAFMSYGSILTTCWCILLITDYYIVRGPMKIGARGIEIGQPEFNVNWRGVGTLAIVTLLASILYATGIVVVPFLVVAPLTMATYILVSWLMRKKVRSGEIA